MASGPSFSGSRNDRWTSGEVYTMLATMNSRIEDISCEFQTDKVAGILFAADLLSKAVGNGCTPERVTSKLKSLWNNACPDMAGKQTDPLYLHGAWTRTLPDLDRLYPGMLESLSNAGMAEQRGRSTRSSNLSHSYNLRRTEKDEENDPYDCRCGYFHYASSSVHCSTCHTWQHVWCYYNTDDKSKPPYNHTCDSCATNPDSPLKFEDVLQQAMANLEIRADETRTRQGSLYSNGKRSTTFDLPPKEDFYMLGTKELESKARSVTSVIEVIAHSMNDESFEVCITAGDLHDQSDICNIFEVLSLDIEDEIISSPKEQTNFLRSVLAASFWQWICYSREIVNTLDSRSNTIDALAYARTQVSLEPREQRAIRSLHYKVWNYLVIDRPEILQPIIAKEAEELTHRLFRMLSVLLKCKKVIRGEGILRTAEDWIHQTPFGLSRFKRIMLLFESGIKLRNLFAMSEYYYELYYPTSVDTKFIDPEPDNVGKKVLFCFMPAILEFEPDLSQRAKWGLSVVMGNQRFISTDSKQKQQSRVACPAVVEFQQ